MATFCCTKSTKSIHMCLGHVVIVCLTLWGAARMFSKVAVPFYISTHSVWGFQFLHILTNSCYLFFFFFFNFSHLRGHEEVSHCGLELNFPKSSWHWTSFYMLVGYISSFEKCIFKRKWKWKLLSRARLFATLYSPWNSLWDSVQPMNSPGQNTGVGSVSHFQGIFPGIKSFFHMAGRFFTSWATREGLQSLKPFLVGLLVFLLVVRVLYIFWIQAPYWIYDL